MNMDRWQEITELFEAILARPRGERTTYLEIACQGDPELRREVENLLAADHQAGSFLESPPAVAEPSEHQSLGHGEHPSQHLGKYEILKKVGQGGFGEVFLGRDPGLRRQVAIKTCNSGDEAFRRRFLREAEIAGRLDHPGIVTVHDSGLAGDVLYLVQEYLPGEDLEESIRLRRPSPVSLRLRQLAQVARGLEYAHGRGVIHRDVKPSNVRVTAHGEVKLLDFGIAKLSNAQTQLTQTGAAMGTMAYMAPEQLRGEEVDSRADIFSFGVLAYELLTYRRPFEAGSNAAMLYQILEKEPVAMARHWPECPHDVASLVARCLEKKAAARYPDFTSLLGDLETLGQRGQHKGRYNTGRWIAAGVLGTLITASGWFYTSGWLHTPLAPSSPPVSGQLAIDALPWAEVVRVVAKDGMEVPLPERRQTPLAIALPPGEYTVELTHPELKASRQCRVLVKPASTAHCSEDFASPDARAFFAQDGG